MFIFCDVMYNDEFLDHLGTRECVALKMLGDLVSDLLGEEC